MSYLLEDTSINYEKDSNAIIWHFADGVIIESEKGFSVEKRDLADDGDYTLQSLRYALEDGNALSSYDLTQEYVETLWQALIDAEV